MSETHLPACTVYHIQVRVLPIFIVVNSLYEYVTTAVVTAVESPDKPGAKHWYHPTASVVIPELYSCCCYYCCTTAEYRRILQAQ